MKMDELFSLPNQPRDACVRCISFTINAKAEGL